MDSKHSYFFHYAICKHSYFFYYAICLSDIQTPSTLLWTVWCHQRRVRWTRRSSSSSWICLCLQYNTVWRPTVRPHWPCVCITATPLYDWMLSPISWTTSTRWVDCLLVWRLLVDIAGLHHHSSSVYDSVPSPTVWTILWTISTRWVDCLVVWCLLADIAGLHHHCSCVYDSVPLPTVWTILCTISTRWVDCLVVWCLLGDVAGLHCSSIWLNAVTNLTTSTRWVDCLVVWCLLADVAGLRHHCSSIKLSAITYLMDHLNTVSGLLVNVAFNHHHTTSVWLSALTYIVDSVNMECDTCLDDLLYCGFWWFIGQHCIVDFDDL